MDVLAAEEGLILFTSAIITLSGCANPASAFLSADQTTTVDGTLFKPDGPGARFPLWCCCTAAVESRPHFVQWAEAIRGHGLCRASS